MVGRPVSIWQRLKRDFLVPMAALAMAGPFSSSSKWHNIRLIWSKSFCYASGATVGVVFTGGLLLGAARALRWLHEALSFLPAMMPSLLS